MEKLKLEYILLTFHQCHYINLQNQSKQIKLIMSINAQNNISGAQIAAQKQINSQKQKVKRYTQLYYLQQTDYDVVTQTFLKNQIQTFRKQIKLINLDINKIIKEQKNVRQISVPQIKEKQVIQDLLIMNISNNKKILNNQHNQYNQILKKNQCMNLYPQNLHIQKINQGQKSQLNISSYIQKNKIKKVNQRSIKHKQQANKQQVFKQYAYKQWVLKQQTYKQKLQKQQVHKEQVDIWHYSFQQKYQQIFFLVEDMKIKIQQLNKNILKLKKGCQTNQKSLFQDKNIILLNYRNLIKKINQKQQKILQNIQQEQKKQEYIQKLQRKTDQVNRQLAKYTNQNEPEYFQFDLRDWQLNKKMYLQVKKRKQKLFKKIQIKKHDFKAKIQSLLKSNQQIKFSIQHAEQNAINIFHKNSKQQDQIIKLQAKYQNIKSQMIQTSYNKKQQVPIDKTNPVYKTDYKKLLSHKILDQKQEVKLIKADSLPTELKKVNKIQNLNKKQNNVIQKIDFNYKLSKLSKSSNIQQEITQKQKTKSSIYKIRVFNKEHQQKQTSIAKNNALKEDDKLVQREKIKDKNFKQDQHFLKLQSKFQVNQGKHILQISSLNRTKLNSFSLSFGQQTKKSQNSYIVKERQINHMFQREYIPQKQYISQNSMRTTSKNEIHSSKANKYLSKQYMRVLQKKGRIILGLDEQQRT